MRPYQFFSVIVAIFGGFLFGFQFVVASGISEFIVPFFNLSEAMLASVISAVLLGAVIGCTFTGSMADKKGRKYTMLFASLLFVLTPIGAYFSNSVITLIVFRFLSGIALGMISTVSPMYLSEVSPANQRGKILSFYQLAIVSGILGANISNYLFSGFGPDSWRFMLGFAAIPGLLLFVGGMLIPESPKWLFIANREVEAEFIMKKMSDNYQVELNAMQDAKNNLHADTKTGFKSLFKGKTGKIVLFGVLLAVFQQLTGISAVFSYAPDIMKAIGIEGNPLFQTISIGLVNFSFTFVAIALVDRLGRKTLMVAGLTMIIIGLSFLSFLYTLSVPSATLMLLSLLIFVAGFSAAVGPVMWVLVSEILPPSVKGPATSVATFSLWLVSMLVAFLFPVMLKSLGTSVSFTIYAFFSVIQLLFILKYIPETKGKTLEEIEAVMMK